MPPFAESSSATPSGDEAGQFFSFLDPEQAAGVPSGPSEPENAAGDFLAPFNSNRPSAKQTNYKSTAARQNQQPNKRNLLIGGGVAVAALLLIVGLTSSRSDLLRSKQGFYQDAMKLARDSRDGFWKGVGPWRSPATAADSQRRQEIHQQLKSINRRLKEIQFAAAPQPDNQPLAIQFGPRTVVPPPVSFESNGGGELEQLAEKSRRLSDEDGKLAAKLCYTLKAGKVKSLLGAPDAIIKQNSYEHIWIYKFSDGAVSLTLVGQGGGDPSNDETLVQVDPSTVEME